MMVRTLAYFDTSVLVKRYVHEAGAVQARALLKRHQFVSSAITPLEALSALTRRQRTGELVGADFDDIVNRLRRDRASWELVEVTAAVLDEAELVVRRTGLRTLDAVHVASARCVRTVIGQPLPFITADVRQRDAATDVGVEVVWVE